MLNTCPHQGFETWRLVSHFYEGLTPRDMQMVELMCNRTFEDKDPNEAMEYLDLLAENAQNWDTTGSYEAPSKTQPHTLAEVCTTLGKILTSKPSLHL